MITKIKTFIRKNLRKMVSQHPKFVFIHVPKCAGSALSVSLLDGIYPSYIKHSSLTTGIDIKKAAFISEITNVHEFKVREIQLVENLQSEYKVFVTGHCYAPPKVVDNFKNEWNFITVLREPVDRFISEFIYNRYKQVEWKNSELSIDEYLDSSVGVSSGLTYCKFFSGLNVQDILADPEVAIEKCISNLANFDQIGFLDSLADWIEKLNGRYGVNIKSQRTNKSPNKEEFNKIKACPELMSKIETLCRFDSIIYAKLKENSI